MVGTIILAVCFGGIVCLLSLFYRRRRLLKLPIGPSGKLLVGNAFQQDPERPYIAWAAWAEKYGDVYTMWNFGKPTVVLNSFEASWEMLVTKSNDFAGRPQQYTMVYCSNNGDDIAICDFNPHWAHMKKTFMTGLKMYGGGQKHLEDIMVDIIAELLEDLKKTNQQPFDPMEFMEYAIANTLSLLCFGSKLEREEPAFRQLLKHIAQDRYLFSQSLSSFAYDAFPWLHYLPLPFSKLINSYADGFVGDWIPQQIQKRKCFGSKLEREEPAFRQLLKHIAQDRYLFSQSLSSFAYDAFPWLHYLPLPFSKLINSYADGFVGDWIPQQIQKRKALFDTDNCECVLDAIFKQQQKDILTGADYPITDRNIVGMATDFIAAGLGTSAATLYITLAILTAKPEIQTKAQEEVHKVLVGRWPALRDKDSMPYVSALLEEVFRYAVIIPAFPHKATRDSEICGHFIPKGTEILQNVWHLCHDSNFWDEPFEFKPERFLNDDGSLLAIDHPNRKRVLVFGAGRRVCPGEQLAKHRIFLIITSLLQNFTLKPVSKYKLPGFDPLTYILGVSLMPQPYQIIAVPRE